MAAEHSTPRDHGEARVEDAAQVSAVIHEVKSALHGVLARVDRLRRQLGTPGLAVPSLRADVDELAEHLQFIMVALNNASPGSLGSYEVTSLDLRPVIGQTIRLLQSFASHQRIRLRFDPTVHVPNVKGSGEHLSQVVFNLLQNAIRYSDSETTVDIQLQQRGDYVLFRVSNTGATIQPEEVKEIFSVGYRTREAQGRGPGSGIGLWVARQIVRQHGGELTIDVEPGTTGHTRTLVEMQVPAESATAR